MHHLTRHLHLPLPRSSSRQHPPSHPNNDPANPPHHPPPPVSLPLPLSPPLLSSLPTSHQQHLLLAIHDYQLTHGMLLKYRQADSVAPKMVPVGVSVFPTPFPRSLWEEVKRVQGGMVGVWVAGSERLGEGGLEGGGEGEGGLGLGRWVSCFL
ncbi:MAG: hypothetical protein Q9160_006669 [Pyrenula sp. 1 TL-2023]